MENTVLMLYYQGQLSLITQSMERCIGARQYSLGKANVRMYVICLTI